MKNIVATLAVILLLTSCQETVVHQTATESAQNQSEYNLQAVLYQQRASENKALYYQAYNTAKLQLDAILNNLPENNNKPLAIITDIDETVLDNSPFNAKLISENKGYSSADWNTWCLLEQAKPLPGAVAFFNYAASKNVETFYISNRGLRVQDATLANLKKYNFPFTDADHIQLKDDTSSKDARRKNVLKNYNVLMYVGDNLSDFATEFEGLNRSQYADSLESSFGTNFILLPNAMYGDWESKEVFKGENMGATPKVKDSIRKAALIGY